MSVEARAIIRWVPSDRGGRRQPPNPATGYATVARFESDAEHGRGAWSLRVVNSAELHGPEAIDATVRFVMPDAPHDLLTEGTRFELLEGKKVVAKGVVLPRSVQAPREINDFELALLG